MHYLMNYTFFLLVAKLYVTEMGYDTLTILDVSLVVLARKVTRA